MELRMWIKQATQYNPTGQPGVFVGPNPQSLVFVPNGSLATNRQIQGYPDYIDITDQVSDLFKLKLTWSTNYDAFGAYSSDVQTKKGTSGTLTFEGEVYKYFKQWLIDDVSAPLNAIAVRIEHVGCGAYEDYQVSARDIEWCDSDTATCTFDANLKQKDDVYTCIQKTLVADNWQQWFQDIPGGGKKHPRFSYCNEQRPNGVLVAVWVLLALVFTILTVIAILIVPIFNSIINILIGVLTVINFIINAVNTLPGVNINDLDDEIEQLKKSKIDIGDIFDSFAAVFLESAGCGREHPAPFIRDYIDNVCKKCGITVTAETAPVFYAQSFNIETSSDGIKPVANPHYNACYLGNKIVKRGIRRFEDIGLFDGTTIDKTHYYIYDNRPLDTLDKFLDRLAKAYNFKWIVREYNGQPTLFIQRKDWYKKGAVVYDFTKTSADYGKLLSMCYAWNSNTFPAATQGLYTEDAADKPGNEALPYFNDIVSHGLTDNNPNYKGINDKTTEFAATKFRLDGASEDYLYGAFQTMLTINGLLLNVVANVFIPVRNRIAELIEVYADYALLLEGETCTLPKILIWDPASGFENAKAVKYGACVNPANFPDLAGYNYPQNNTKYNTTTEWQSAHPPITKVAGSQFSIGFYRLQNITGTFKIKKPALLINFPMIMGVGYKDTMWDWWHWIDDPAKNPQINQTFTAKIPLCCEDLKRLGVFGNVLNVKLLEKVKLSTGFYPEGYIREITVSYDPSDEQGQYIEIKGDV